jgi:hypothetical protein
VAWDRRLGARIRLNDSLETGFEFGLMVGLELVDFGGVGDDLAAESSHVEWIQRWNQAKWWSDSGVDLGGIRR